MRHETGRGGARILLLATVAAALWIPTGCVPDMTSPARDAGDYREKASSTAGAAIRDDAFGPYLSVAVGDAERDLDAVSSTFGSILPPGEASILLRDELEPVLDRAATHVADARIAIRRGEPDDLPRIRRELRADVAELQALEERTS